MAYQRYGGGYQYETTPRKLEPEYEPIRKDPYPKKKSAVKKVEKVKTQKKAKAKRKLKPKAKLVFSIMAGFIILFGISYQNSLITETFNKKEELKKNLSAVQKENEQLRVNIENSLNLNNIEQLAKEKLGMQKLDNAQKKYISLDKKDYVEPATEEVVIQQEEGLWQKLINGLTKSIK
ncbi:MAG: hypothetical protein ACLTEH_00995 [Clostridia bacterium]